MTTSSLIFKEIFHRKSNFVLSLLAITLAVAFAVGFFTTGEASKRETIRLMRDMGYNLRIIAKDTNMDSFYANGYSDRYVPEDYVQKFSNHKGLLYAHLLATLQRSIEWRGRHALLTGLAAEYSPEANEKSPMIFTIEPGTVHLGYDLAHSLGIQKGDSVEILGTAFTVAGCLQEAGSQDDIRILAALSDVQNLLGLQGKINEIQALNCRCVFPKQDPLVMLREQLATILPDMHVIFKRSIADARTKQRELMENYFGLIMPFLLVVCAIWLGALAWINTRDRQAEIGILRALGYDSARIAFLFLGKAIFIGVTGAVAGFILGTAFAMVYGAEIFKVTFEGVKPMYHLLGISLGAAPLFVAVSSFIPAMLAATLDPAECLRED